MPNPIITFEGPSNADNQGIFGFQVSPPDPVGDVGRRHYMAMVNLTFAVYFKASGALVFGPADIGTLWQGFPITDCTDASGDPIVFYDQVANRWVLTQFTTRGPNYYNCMAVSKTQDPLGAYNLYAFTTGANFPDYPKYGMWTNSYTITTREFDPVGNESVGIYAVNRQQILQGNPNPTVVSFNLSSPTYLVGDGLLAADFDGLSKPPARSPQYILGTMDDGYSDGAPFDGINVFQLKVNFANPPSSTFGLTHQLAITNFDTVFPCSPSGSRNCIKQPGTTRRIAPVARSSSARPPAPLCFSTKPSICSSAPIDSHKAPRASSIATRKTPSRRSSGALNRVTRPSADRSHTQRRWTSPK
jgi:hypothetical protein